MPICRLKFAFLEFSNGSLVSFILFVFFYSVFFIAMGSFRNVLLLKFRGKWFRRCSCCRHSRSENLRDLERDFKGHLVLLSFQGLNLFCDIPGPCLATSRHTHLTTAGPALLVYCQPCADRPWRWRQRPTKSDLGWAPEPSEAECLIYKISLISAPRIIAFLYGMIHMKRLSFGK